MSMQAVRPYISKYVTQVGFTEWEDPFNDENIASNILDGAFHQVITSAENVDINNVSHGFDVTSQITVFFKGFREPKAALDQSIVKTEELIVALCDPANFKANTLPITSVFIDSVRFEPYDVESNDNVIKAILMCRMRVYVCIQ
jgi:hypothetical protein